MINVSLLSLNYRTPMMKECSSSDLRAYFLFLTVVAGITI